MNGELCKTVFFGKTIKFVLRQEYEKINGLGDRLDHLKGMINWERFRPFFAGLFFNDDKTGGRPRSRRTTVCSAKTHFSRLDCFAYNLYQLFTLKKQR